MKTKAQKLGYMMVTSQTAQCSTTVTISQSANQSIHLIKILFQPLSESVSLRCCFRDKIKFKIDFKAEENLNQKLLLLLKVELKNLNC